MNKFEIDLNLEHVAAQRKVWNDAAREFGDRVDKAMKRLIHEAAAARMSHVEVAKKAGFTTAQIKARMKTMGLNPTTGRSLLSKQAAAVLASNAEIMGIQPHEIDLMSPLAYLPAGSLLKEQDNTVKDLDEFGYEKRVTPSMRASMMAEGDPDPWEFPKTRPACTCAHFCEGMGGRNAPCLECGGLFPETPLVHTMIMDYSDQPLLACESSARDINTTDAPVLICDDIEQITCPDCRTFLNLDAAEARKAREAGA